MKKHPLIPLLIPLLLAACGERPNILIRGEIKDGAGARVYLERIDPSASATIDSARLDKQGQFAIALRDTLPPVFLSLRFSNNERVNLVASPGDTLLISGSLAGLHDNYWVDGSEDALWIKLLDFQMSRTLAQLDSLRRAGDSIPAGTTFDNRRAALERDTRDVLEKQVTFTRDFILAHAISPAAYYALYQRVTPQLAVMDELADQHSFKTVASSMLALYPDSPYTISLLNHLKEIAARSRDRQIRELVDQAEPALPAVRLPDRDGKIIDMATLKGRLIILDFTILAAKESQTATREMQRVHQRFRDRGVNIYQVCLDPSRLAWEDAVEQLGLTWTVVRDSNALRSNVAAAWNIREIPANYIINNKKEIVGKNLYGARLEERLEELLAP